MLVLRHFRCDLIYLSGKVKGKFALIMVLMQFARLISLTPSL